MKRQYLTICILLFALVVVLSIVVVVAISQAHLYRYPDYLYTPTPNIYK